MSVSIRLARQGTKKRPFYRVVVTNTRSPRGGRFLENIGTFDPAKKTEDSPFHVDAERLAFWQGRGAIASETVTRLIKALVKNPSVARAPAAPAK